MQRDPVWARPRPVPPLYASLSISVRYFGVTVITFFMNAACSAPSSFGGSVVRVATGVPTSVKNSSRPAGEEMQRTRVAFAEML